MTVGRVVSALVQPGSDGQPAKRERPREPGRGEPRRYCGRWYRLCGRALEGSSSRRSDLRTKQLFGPPCRLFVLPGGLRSLQPPEIEFTKMATEGVVESRSR